VPAPPCLSADLPQVGSAGLPKAGEHEARGLAVVRAGGVCVPDVAQNLCQTMCRQRLTLQGQAKANPKKRCRDIGLELDITGITFHEIRVHTAGLGRESVVEAALTIVICR
jgi:hypothetical protein